MRTSSVSSGWKLGPKNIALLHSNDVAGFILCAVSSELLFFARRGSRPMTWTWFFHAPNCVFV